MRSGCCRYSFEKQPEGRSRISAKGAGVARRARAERKSKGETLVSERQDGLQFPLRPHNPWETRVGSGPGKTQSAGNAFSPTL
jgi:hypothetical protein